MINACNHITCAKAEAGRSLSLKPARTKKRFCVCVCGGGEAVEHTHDYQHLGGWGPSSVNIVNLRTI